MPATEESAGTIGCPQTNPAQKATKINVNIPDEWLPAKVLFICLLTIQLDKGHACQARAMAAHVPACSVAGVGGFDRTKHDIFEGHVRQLADAMAKLKTDGPG